ncbi:PEPxxWA-CTERM sorting domain-containing protein [Sphingomonas glaciei]|uniref:PEPxxWA-CTERM sorting domain-containing protein n=1 Tax=Sphingomonas glaciei TaxID=2938948 RepID=A0ABY5MWW5_9SPHN|nr:PEPxxWA-CTERM sorting domain-containing protein [Sphingomonas glaciei]UUR08953.1 PEPxxWA-CTERM sorting domain-containing protein [Sphingomonas glaciei]
MKTFSLSIAAIAAATFATPASATVEVTTGATTGCSAGPIAPSADKCAGYYSNNQFSNQSDNVALQQSAINALLGAGNYTVDFNALVANGKVVSDKDLTALGNLLATAGGQVLLGFHWGNVPGPQGNVSAFYLWNNVPAGSIRLTDTGGYSNAVLYRATAVTTAVPEPGTWALMLVGFGAVGGAMRRRRRETVIPQFA